MFQKRNRELKQTTEHDEVLKKRYSLDIPVLPESEEDKKYASLLSMKTSRSVEDNRELKRKQLLFSAALPSSDLTYNKEQKALKVLSRDTKNHLGIVKKNEITTSCHSLEEASTSSKAPTAELKAEKSNPVVSLVGDYTSGSESD